MRPIPTSWRYRTTALALCMAVYFGSRTGQVALATLGPDVVAALDVSVGLFGVAFTGLSAASALAQFPSGVLSDRYGERRVILAAVVLVGLGTASLALAPNYAAFLALTVVLGVGSGLYYSPSAALLDDLYDRIGWAIGTYRVSGQLAGAVVPVAVGVVAVRYGWRGTILAAGLAMGPVLVALVAFMRPTSPSDPGTSLRSRASSGYLRGLLTRPGLASALALAGLLQFVEVAAFTFLPTVLRTHHGLPTAVVGVLYALYFGTVAALQPVAGWLSDRHGRPVVTAGTLLAGVVGFGLLARPAPLAMLVAGVVLAGASMTWGAPLQARVVDLLDESERGTGFGFVRTVYLLVGSLGGAGVGAVATVAGWAVGVAVMAGLLAAGLVGLVAVTTVGPPD